MKQNVLYYQNTGKASKTTRELISSIFHKLAENLSDPDFLDFLSKSRVPNERELYGLFVKSIIQSCGGIKDVGHISTEFQVTKENDAKGRVDLFFTYRSVSYLIELKVGRINARGDDKEPKKQAKDIWHKAINQLDDLKTDSLTSLLRKKVVKLPIALYFFTSKIEINDELDINHKSIHENIYEFIKGDGFNDKPKFTPDFELYSSVPRTPTRLRKTELSSKTNNYLYGFSIIGKQINA